MEMGNISDCFAAYVFVPTGVCVCVCETAEKDSGLHIVQNRTCNCSFVVLGCILNARILQFHEDE